MWSSYESFMFAVKCNIWQQLSFCTKGYSASSCNTGSCNRKERKIEAELNRVFRYESGSLLSEGMHTNN